MPKGGCGSIPSCGAECKRIGVIKGNLSHIHNCNKMSGPDTSCASIRDARHIFRYSQARQALRTPTVSTSIITPLCTS